MLEIGQKIHGFKVASAEKVQELDATLYEMDYEKNGAKLYFLERDDENKTFSIGFKTIPEDDTGVFHIIEHSVLCGSRKYPVKEPFVELLKGSLQTFLNAMTFPDKTMYPFATRNDKDYLNLMNVYLDAVFHPAILKNPNIFRQEGWHYEFDANGNLCRKGVVYNEMKGAYSSPDTQATYNVMKMLYPNTPYSYESGGKPDGIPSLTYEQFIASHSKYYHPSNSQIFLDGSVNIDDALLLIDSYLCEYDALGIDFDIEDQSECPDSRMEIEYEIAPTESEEDKTRVALGFLSTRFDENRENLALSIIYDAICSGNESPLKKKIIESGLCEDFYIATNDSMKRQFIQVNFTNVKDGKCDELISLFYESVKEICLFGIDKELLEASLNNFEFKSRERDFGSLPKGIIFAIGIMASTLYGGDPTQELKFDELFLSLRKALSTEYYEELLKRLVLENKNRATLIMTPSKTLGERREAKEREELDSIKASLGDEQIASIKSVAEEIEAWQKSEDGEEALATLPSLTLDDIPVEIKDIPTVVEEIDTRPVLYHEINTSGIVYANMYFDASDLSAEEAYLLKLCVMLTKEVPTESYDVIALQKKIKSNLGSLAFSVKNFSAQGETKIQLQVSASALNSKKEELVSLVKETLLTSDYGQRDTVLTVLRQSKLSLEEFFVDAGHAAGMARARAAISASGVVDEYTGGYEAYRITKELIEKFDERYGELIDKINAIKTKILNKSRLFVSITGEGDRELAEALCNIVERNEKVVPVCKIKPFGIKKEGIVIPAQIGYATAVNSLLSLGLSQDGSYGVVRSLLSYAHLWNTVRVQGGAYGAGFSFSNESLNIGFYSYRDPTPKRSLECYRQSSEFLRSFVASGADLTKFIIGAVGDMTPLMSQAMMGRVADSRYFCGVAAEDVAKRREELLKTDGEKLLKIADTLDELYKTAPVCIVASKEKLDECDFLDAVLTL